MKQILLFLSLCFVFSSVSVFAVDGIESPKSCQLCGMDRTTFAQSRMLIVYADGSKTGTCSVHCVAAELKANADKRVQSLLVADYNSKSLIDAKQATWVIGGKKRGVMTALPKWAFAKRSDADAFVKQNDGKVAGFDEAMALAEKE